MKILVPHEVYIYIYIYSDYIYITRYGIYYLSYIHMLVY